MLANILCSRPASQRLEPVASVGRALGKRQQAEIQAVCQRCKALALRETAALRVVTTRSRTSERVQRSHLEAKLWFVKDSVLTKKYG